MRRNDSVSRTAGFITGMAWRVILIAVIIFLLLQGIRVMNASGLGIKAGTNNVVSTFTKAGTAMKAIQNAISSVSKQRSALGALQNRLEHTVANLDNVAENTQSAESRIRDTDMAEEMVEYSKNNILAQAGQSMLAQANQSTQGVLSLLQ